MAPKRRQQEDRGTRRSITVALKREIIEKRERGASVAFLAQAYRRSASTICTILKNRDKFKETEASRGVSRISSQRPRHLDGVERLLLPWIEERRQKGEPVNENVVCEKARSMYAELVKETPGTSADGEAFKASRGWYDRFRRRCGMDRTAMQQNGEGEPSSATEELVAEFLEELVNSQSYAPQQVFSCAETRIFWWESMPKRTAGEKTASEDHEEEDHPLVVVLCANASGDLKLDPLVVSQSGNPGSPVDVMWRTSGTATPTRDLLADWINQVFGPSVKNYLTETDLPLRALLVADDRHPVAEEDLLEEFKFVRIHRLPRDAVTSSPAMDQQVVSSFENLYTEAASELCGRATRGADPNLEDHFDVVSCCEAIAKAWEGVTKGTITRAWKALWPERVAVDQPMDPVVVEVVSLAKDPGLRVGKVPEEETDGEELEEPPRPEVVLEISSSGEEDEVAGSTDRQVSGEIRAMLKAWESVASYVEAHHPDKELAARAVNQFNDVAVSHFRKLLMRSEM